MSVLFLILLAVSLDKELLLFSLLACVCLHNSISPTFIQMTSMVSLPSFISFSHFQFSSVDLYGTFNR